MAAELSAGPPAAVNDPLAGDGDGHDDDAEGLRRLRLRDG
jgi:hypothetical protein